MPAFYLSPIGNAQVYLASNGQPANGALINTYLAGTTTPAATFTSISGAINNTNPIVLTPAGMAPQPIWLTGGQAYKFIITDALGNQIGTTEDNVRGIGDGSAGGGIINPMTAVGDLIVGGTVVGGIATPNRIGIGSTGQVLTVSGGTAVWSASAVATTATIMSGQSWGMFWGDSNTNALDTVGLAFFGGYPTYTAGAGGIKVNPSMTASLLGTIRRVEQTTNSAASNAFVGYAVNSTGIKPHSPLQISTTTGLGGFYCELYAGIGENYAAAQNASFFLGLCSYDASIAQPNVWSNGASSDFLGIGVPNSTQNWATVTQLATAAPTVTALSPTLGAAAQQLWALSFSNTPGSAVITMNASLLTAIGTWTPKVTNLTFTSATGTALWPTLMLINNGGSGTSGVIWHRFYWQADGTQVPKAF